MDDDTLAKAGEGDVRNRATDGAVLEDKFDRAALPKVMQVKDFGFQGRTKYTHLSDQDTTFVDRDNPMKLAAAAAQGRRPVKAGLRPAARRHATSTRLGKA